MGSVSEVYAVQLQSTGLQCVSVMEHISVLPQTSASFLLTKWHRKCKRTDGVMKNQIPAVCTGVCMWVMFVCVCSDEATMGDSWCP